MMGKLLELFSKAKAYYSGLKPRERTFILIGIAAVVAMALIFSVTGDKKKPGARRDSLTGLYKQRDEFLNTAEKYTALKTLLGKIDGRIGLRPADFDLYARINELAFQTGVRTAMIKMDPGSSTSNDYLDEDYVDVVFQRIDLISITNFMEKVESLPGLVRITQLSIKTRFDQSQTLDVVMRISAYANKAGGPGSKESRPKPEPLLPGGGK